MSDETFTSASDEVTNPQAEDHSVIERGPLGADVVAPPENILNVEHPAPTSSQPVNFVEPAQTILGGNTTYEAPLTPGEVHTADSATIPVATSEDGTVRTLPEQREVMSPVPGTVEDRAVAVGDEVTVRLGANRGTVATISEIRYPQGPESQPIFLAEANGNDFWLVRGEFDLGSNVA